MSVYLYMQAHVAVCVSNICALSPHSRWGSERHRSLRVPQPRLAWHPRSGRGDILPVPALPPIPTRHCPPDPPRWDLHCGCAAAVTAVTAVPTKGVCGGGWWHPPVLPRLSGVGLSWEDEACEEPRTAPGVSGCNGM